MGLGWGRGPNCMKADVPFGSSPWCKPCVLAGVYFAISLRIRIRIRIEVGCCGDRTGMSLTSLAAAML